MKKLIITLVLVLFPLISQAQEIRNSHVILQGHDGGQIAARNLYEMTLENTDSWYYLGSQDRYLLLYDSNDIYQNGNPPIRNLAFRIPNLGSTHVVFKTPETFNDNLIYCISDDPSVCSPAGNGPWVSGVLVTD